MKILHSYYISKKSIKVKGFDFEVVKAFVCIDGSVFIEGNLKHLSGTDYEIVSTNDLQEKYKNEIYEMLKQHY